MAQPLQDAVWQGLVDLQCGAARALRGVVSSHLGTAAALRHLRRRLSPRGDAVLLQEGEQCFLRQR